MWIYLYQILKCSFCSLLPKFDNVSIDLCLFKILNRVKWHVLPISQILVSVISALILHLDFPSSFTWHLWPRYWFNSLKFGHLQHILFSTKFIPSKLCFLTYCTIRSCTLLVCPCLHYFEIAVIFIKLPNKLEWTCKISTGHHCLFKQSKIKYKIFGIAQDHSFSYICIWPV